MLLALRPARLPILCWIKAFLKRWIYSFRWHFVSVLTVIYLLLSMISTGSSSICVTLGRVSSAFNTGNVFDKKSSVRFRISSLKWDVIIAMVLNIDDRHKIWKHLQWIWFTEDILAHWISWNLSFIQISAYVVNRNECIFTWDIFTFQINVRIGWWANFRWYTRRGFNESVIAAK